MNTSGTYSLSRAMKEEVPFSMAIGHGELIHECKSLALANVNSKIERRQTNKRGRSSDTRDNYGRKFQSGREGKKSRHPN